MKRHPAMLLGSLFFAAAVLAGCAAEPNAKAASQHSLSSRDSGNLVFAYRRQARVLRDLASRLEDETYWYEQQLGEDHERTRQSREAANATWAAAEEADELARTYQRQLPQGGVY